VNYLFICFPLSNEGGIIYILIWRELLHAEYMVLFTYFVGVVYFLTETTIDILNRKDVHLGIYDEKYLTNCSCTE